jgi:hypothetical protein
MCILGQLLRRLCECHSGRGPRVERRITGFPLPPALAGALLEELTATSWPRPRERGKVAAGEYLTVSPANAGRHPRLWALAAETVAVLDPSFAYTAIAATKNFCGSPHIDTHDVGYQWALSLGTFSGGGQLCLEVAPDEASSPPVTHVPPHVHGQDRDIRMALETSPRVHAHAQGQSHFPYFTVFHTLP